MKIELKTPVDEDILNNCKEMLSTMPISTASYFKNGINNRDVEMIYNSIMESSSKYNFSTSVSMFLLFVILSISDEKLGNTFIDCAIEMLNRKYITIYLSHCYVDNIKPSLYVELEECTVFELTIRCDNKHSCTDLLYLFKCDIDTLILINSPHEDILEENRIRNNYATSDIKNIIFI